MKWLLFCCFGSYHMTHMTIRLICHSIMHHSLSKLQYDICIFNLCPIPVLKINVFILFSLSCILFSFSSASPLLQHSFYAICNLVFWTNILLVLRWHGSLDFLHIWHEVLWSTPASRHKLYAGIHYLSQWLTLWHHVRQRWHISTRDRSNYGSGTTLRAWI